jgi:ribonuclease III
MESTSASTHAEAGLDGLAAVLRHTFRRPELLSHALTHRSLAHEQAQGTVNGSACVRDNERLEFLGDAVLGLVVGEALFQMHPEWNEGELTVVRSRLVSRQHMASVASAIDLGSYLRLSRGEERGGLRRASTVLSNTMEAVLGALYLDGGLEPVREFARRYVMGPAVEELEVELRAGRSMGNYKSALQEYAQASRLGAPVYRVKSESGPDHRKRFLVEVRLKPAQGEQDKTLALGRGTTKKLAEQDAARRALARLTADGAKPLSEDREAPEDFSEE